MFVLWSALACACAVVVAQGSLTPSRVVTIQQGPVRGFKAPDADVYVYRNIPYATAPTGRDRYKAPLPPPTWIEPLGTNVEEPVLCRQSLGNVLVGQEDCLVANVYAPDTQESDLPVLISVHGGAFMIGFGEMSQAVGLVQTKKMVVVNFNYRLGVHGFLCLGNEEAPGNAGLKDQVALLRWVQANIAAFGGNPMDVTIGGCSAGAVSVDLLRLSKTTDGLFNKVITASGGNVGAISVQIDPMANAKWFARELNVSNVDDIASLTNFYTNSTLDFLLTPIELYSFNRHDSVSQWVPCVENGKDTETFLSDSPVNILRKGEYKHLPMLYGFADMDGLIRVAGSEELDFPSYSSFMPLMNERFSDFLPGDLEFDSDEEKEAVAARVRKFYFKDEKIDERQILAYIDYFTDILFAYPMLRVVKLNAQKQNIFLYEYSFTDKNTPPVLDTGVKGADHCDQYGIIFDEDESILTPEYKTMKTVMRKIILDFMETGNPVGEGSTLPLWSPADGDRAPHMHLDGTPSLRGALLQERTQLWDGIYEAHYRPPIPPTASGTPPTRAASINVSSTKAPSTNAPLTDLL